MSVEQPNQSRSGLASRRDDIDWSAKFANGEESPNFSGGKYIDDKGYVRVLNPDHPKNIRGYVYEHRLVIEQYLNRYLQPWETVHHINEIKIDNRLSNLFLCTPQEHSALHKEGVRMKDEQKQKMRKTAQETKPHTKKKNASKKIVIKKRLP
jgi:hypothetical protein